MFPVLVLISILCAVLQLPTLHPYMVWDQALILDGQWWRIVTGNFTHTNSLHLAMNLVGLWLIAYVFKPTPIRLFYLLLVLSSVSGTLLLFTDIGRYVGLSGVLHGAFAFWALQEALNGRKSSWTLVVGVVAKVLWEQVYGASEATSALIDARVATEAHLFGLICGLCFAVLLTLVKRRAD